MSPRVLIGCEFSGIVRQAFEKLGWYAVSCDGNAIYGVFKE